MEVINNENVYNQYILNKKVVTSLDYIDECIDTALLLRRNKVESTEPSSTIS